MRIAVLGGGQLGRMLALAAHPLGLTVRCLDPSSKAPAGAVTDLVVGAFDDEAALAKLADGADRATYELENLPVHTGEVMARMLPLHPSLRALEVGQERVAEKTFFRSHGLEVPEFVSVDSREQLERGVETLGLPAVLKTRRFGYDGKGQFVLRAREDVDEAWVRLGGWPLILERFVAFRRELSVLAVRSEQGEVRAWPLVENHHVGGILIASIAPAPGVSPALQALGERYARTLMEALDYVGVLALETFDLGDRLVANEMAPRVHNSGHWTIEGAETSQFENHLRAVAGLPLGSTTTPGRVVMVNLIGTPPPSEVVLAIPGARLHLYGKEPRLGRKIGHVTLVAPTPQELAARLELLAKVVPVPDAALASVRSA